MTGIGRDGLVPVPVSAVVTASFCPRRLFLAKRFESGWTQGAEYTICRQIASHLGKPWTVMQYGTKSSPSSPAQIPDCARSSIPALPGAMRAAPGLFPSGQMFYSSPGNTVSMEMSTRCSMSSLPSPSSGRIQLRPRESQETTGCVSLVTCSSFPMQRRYRRAAVQSSTSLPVFRGRVHPTR